MNKNFTRLMFVTLGILIILGSLIVVIRYVTNQSVTPDTSDETVTLGSGTDTVKMSNPIQSKDFVSLGSGMYVSDARTLGESAGFSMVYYAEGGSFAIDISGKPTAVYREKASRYLLSVLNISETEACQLRLYVGVSHATDPSLSGKNLGLSFCPGSVKL